MNVLAVDVGTSVVKAAVVDSHGKVSGSASKRTEISTPALGAVEIDATDITRLPIEIMAAARAEAGIPSEEISAISVTGARGTILAFDENNHPVGTAIAWADRRGSHEVAEFVEVLGGWDTVSGVLGINPDPTLSVAAIIQLKRGNSGRSIRRFAGPQATVIEGLTGDPVTDLSHAGYYGFAGVSDTDWNPEYCNAAGIKPGQLPFLVPAGSVAGTLTKAAAKELGLLQGLPVIAAASDSVCYKIGAGIVAAGQGIISLGTAASMNVVSDRRVTISQRVSISCTPSATLGTWDVTAIHPSAGLMLDWLKKIVRFDKPSELDRIIEASGDVDPGADGLIALPYLFGSSIPRDANVGAAFIGIRAAHGNRHMTRAILEGVGYALNDLFDGIARLVNRPTSFRLVGGSARSLTWAKILTDILATPIETVSAEEPALVGAAAVAAVQIGLYGDLESAVSAMTSVDRRLEPGPAAEHYDSAYQRYRQLAETIRRVSTDS